jgi:hypothetical protein
VLFWRAHIAAALGDRAKAVALIRELLGGGFHPCLWHPTELYMRLREDPAFQALTRPRG